MTPNSYISVRLASLGVRRLVEALRLEGQCFGPQSAKALRRRNDDIRLPQKVDAKGEKRPSEREG